jgi:hypothetical protein
MGIRSQGKKKRQHGTDAIKGHILAAKTVANIVKSSLVRDCLASGVRSGNQIAYFIHLHRDLEVLTRSSSPPMAISR